MTCGIKRESNTIKSANCTTIVKICLFSVSYWFRQTMTAGYPNPPGEPLMLPVKSYD